MSPQNEMDPTSRCHFAQDWILMIPRKLDSLWLFVHNHWSLLGGELATNRLGGAQFMVISMGFLWQGVHKTGVNSARKTGKIDPLAVFQGLPM